MTITAEPRTTSPQDSGRPERASNAGDVQAVRKRMPAVWAAAGVVLVLVGVVAGVFAFSAASRATQVFVAADPIARGTVIQADDLTTLSIASGQPTAAFTEAQAGDVIGTIAAVDIPAGGLITDTSVTDQLTVPQGRALVGLTLTTGQLPAQRLHAGDTVYLVPVPPQGVADAPPVTATDTIAATVSQVTPVTNSTDVVVDVYVSSQAAPQVTALAASGTLAIYLVPGADG